MVKLDREQTIAVAALSLVVLCCTAAPILSLKARADAVQALADEREMLARLQRAHRQIGHKGEGSARIRAAPSAAFLNAQTSGLASAQFEAYLSQVALAQQANLISSGVQQARSSDARDMVRIQAILNINYAALQGLLFKLETGTPYVFIDSMTLQTAETTGEYAPVVRVTLNLRAIWRRTHM
ncbi:MAG: type II secretion system protein GspM [Methylovirgula sp.]